MDKTISEATYSELINSIDKLTMTLNEHSEELKNHKSRLNHLAKTIDRLDSTINVASGLQTPPPSPQLRNLLNEFMDNYINPKFYSVQRYKTIADTSRIVRARLPGGSR